MHSTKWSRGVVALLAAVVMTACSSSAKKSGDGSLSVSVAAIGTGVAQSVFIRVYGNGVDRTIQATGDAQNRVFTADFTLLPAGSYLVHGWGYDANDPVQVPPAAALYENRGGDIPLSIVAAQNTPLSMTLQELNPAATLAHAPIISFISASMFNVEVGAAAVTLTARATDADANLLDWTWSDVPAGGTFGTPGGSFSTNPQTFSTTWTPAAGTSGLVTISLTITDSTLNASTITIILNVVPAGAGTGSATIVATINAVPIVVDPIVVTNGQIPANTLTQFGTSAYDPDPIDTPTFVYSSDCGGNFASQVNAPFDLAAPVGPANPIISTVDFLAPSPAPASGLCTVTVTISDARGSSVVQNFVIAIGDPLIAYAPEFTLNTFAVPATSPFFPAAAGAVVNFQAEAFQRVDAGTVNLAPGSFAWAFPAEGSVSPELGSGTLSQRAWTLPAAPVLCTLPAGSGQIVTYTVNVTASGAVPAGVAGPLDTTRAISIQVACP